MHVPVALVIDVLDESVAAGVDCHICLDGEDVDRAQVGEPDPPVHMAVRGQGGAVEDHPTDGDPVEVRLGVAETPRCSELDLGLRDHPARRGCQIDLEAVPRRGHEAG
jgi:hypothetical protein